MACLREGNRDCQVFQDTNPYNHINIRGGEREIYNSPVSIIVISLLTLQTYRPSILAIREFCPEKKNIFNKDELDSEFARYPAF